MADPTGPPQAPPVRIAAVIVTYNSADVLEGCVASLHADSEGVELVRVVVADNASRDDSLKLAADLGALAVAVGRNAGYAAGINAGVAALDLDEVDAVLILNPDCRVRPGALATLAATLHGPGRGLAAPRLVNPDGTLQPTLRRRPTVHRALAEAVLGGRLTGRFTGLGELIMAEGPHQRPGPAAWATGAILLVSADAVRATGPWDESFLMYSEETEYIFRAADHGFALWYEPAAVVEHIGAASGFNTTLYALATVNKTKLFRMRRDPLSAAAYFTALTLGEGLRALTGRPESRAAFTALVRPSRRLRQLAGG